MTAPDIGIVLILYVHSNLMQGEKVEEAVPFAANSEEGGGGTVIEDPVMPAGNEEQAAEDFEDVTEEQLLAMEQQNMVATQQPEKVGSLVLTHLLCAPLGPGPDCKALL